jgi:hypothetical protein
MPETVYNLYEAKSSLSRLVERAAAGEEIIIAPAVGECRLNRSAARGWHCGHRHVLFEILS